MDRQLNELHRRQLAAGPRLYIGAGVTGWAWAEPEQAVLVLGPPRSGKTTSLAVPNVLAAAGAVVATSTKPDVLTATVAQRSQLGRCWLLDPTGTVSAPAGVTPVRWSPVAACSRWDEALVVARGMVGAARPGAQRGEAGHWSERAEALLAPLFHAAARAGSDMRVVVRWVLRQDFDSPRAILVGHGAELPADVLAGLAATDTRELSGIWSTAAGVLAAYRSEAALTASASPNIEPASLIAGHDTVYVCAPARQQALAAPIVVAFLDQVRAGAYRAAASGRPSAPVVLALDELANIAPLPDLPALVSEGGGQGVLTLACLQDLSQARVRWGEEAAGFLSLFGTKVCLPGIGDLPTLEHLSRLAGDMDVPQRSTSQGPWWGPGHGAETVSWAPRRQRRLAPDAISQLPTGSALVLSGREPPSRVRLVPWTWPTTPAPGLRREVGLGW
jgi:type IV secretion system protein VirD4